MNIILWELVTSARVYNALTFVNFEVMNAALWESFF